MINIVGNCMESKELTKSMILHLYEEVQRLGMNTEEEENDELPENE